MLARSTGRLSFPLAAVTLHSCGLPVIAMLLCLNLATSSAVAFELDAPAGPQFTAGQQQTQRDAGRRATVRIEKDVDYLGAARTEKADLYLPGNVAPGERRPGIVIIHGGGWSSGDKAAARERNIGSTLAQHGYVCLSINYVLSKVGATEVLWPRNLNDCKTAVRWLRKHAERLQLDPDHIGTIGGSAGGHLATMVALTVTKDCLDPAVPDGQLSCRVQAVVNLYGAADLVAWQDLSMLGRKKRSAAPELYRAASLATYADKNDPPILIIHGTSDQVVEVDQSQNLAAALARAGTPYQLVIVEGAEHGFHLEPKQEDLRPLVLGFLDRHLKTKP